MIVKHSLPALQFSPRRLSLVARRFLLILLGVFTGPPIVWGQSPFAFEDMTAQTGLHSVLETPPSGRAWRYAHGAGWGDVDGDGRPDLYIGAFAARPWYQGADAPTANRLFLNRPDGFVASARELEFPERMSRCAGVLFVDLDQDSDLDLVVANHVTKDVHGGSRVYENTGNTSFRDVTPRADDWPGRIGMRNVTALDLNRDGLLDLLVADGSYGSAARSARLVALQNLGNFRFRDVTTDLGFPESETSGLGLAVGDVNDDGMLDVFVAGSNRLFVTSGDRGFREAAARRFDFAPADVREGLHCGAAFGDLDGDGQLDLVTTEHGVPARIHVFHHRGCTDGVPDYAEVTGSAGVAALFPRGTRAHPIKTAHVALADMDHDGRRDIVLTTVFRDQNGVIQPVVLRNLTDKTGELKFAPPPFERMTTYYAPGPLGDFDRDGRLDLFLPSWFEDVPNRLMRNVTPAGSWLVVRVAGRGPGFNRMGIGATVRLYEAGHAPADEYLIGRAEIVTGTGYASCEEARAHFGLGERASCDVVVSWQGHEIKSRHQAVNQTLQISFPPR